MKSPKSILSYWDRALFGGLCWYAVLNQMQAVAIAFAILAVIRAKRAEAFVLAIISKIEQSDKGNIGPLGWDNRRDPTPLPKSDLKKIDVDVQSGAIPEDFYKLFQAGILGLQQGDIQKAKRMFEEAEALDPENFEVHAQLGFVYDLTREYQRSIDHSKKALEIKPDSFTAQFNLSVAENHLHGAVKSLPEYLKAEKIAQKVGGIDDRVTIGKLNLFIAHDCRDLRNYEEAKERYNSAIIIFSLLDSPIARRWLKEANDGLKRLEGNV